jgi:RES domain-containing protein
MGRARTGTEVGGRVSAAASLALRSISLARLEYFVHLDRDKPPTDLVLATATVPDHLKRRRIEMEELPSDWRDSPSPSQLTAIGDEFIGTANTAILIVPSAISPSESNWLLNPLHPDFPRVEIRPLQPFRYDKRLLG